MPAEPSVAVAIFARAPRAGRTKTRLAAAIGAERAASLYRAFLDDVVAKVRAWPTARPVLWAAAPDDVAPLAALHPDLEVRPQPAGDLGARMGSALADGLTRGPRTLLIGSDVPTAPSALLRAAARALEHAGSVWGPVADGGFWLVGARDRPPDLAGGVRWSSRHALADSLRRAPPGRAVLLRPWYDVDTPEDLRLLRAHLAVRPRDAPVTAAALGVAGRGPGSRSRNGAARHFDPASGA
ncbi:MAG TPA: TIGR04282 family arsenosugar biosynthesis glycosyltransferase [Sandaracinaceae bacterium LLY-WYZ-13_1]|nr:TIGR04282 family arsenosugar biosynthesis glycosyltransferase [Sandaracinaceae bacterium LLY-WYZ-13_1]